MYNFINKVLFYINFKKIIKLYCKTKISIKKQDYYSLLNFIFHDPSCDSSLPKEKERTKEMLVNNVPNTKKKRNYLSPTYFS